MRAFLTIFGGAGFLVSIALHIYVKLRLRPREEELEDYYHELEDLNPQLSRYDRWSRITFSAAVISALVMFVGLVI